MKQNDWIVIGVSAVILIGALIYSITQARAPEIPPQPQQVPTNKVDIPKTAIVMQNGLPGAENSGGEGGFGGGAGAAPGDGGPGRGKFSVSAAGSQGR